MKEIGRKPVSLALLYCSVFMVYSECIYRRGVVVKASALKRKVMRSNPAEVTCRIR